jgi:hypothetical protein
LHKTLLGSRLIVGDIFSYGEVLQAAGQPALVFPLEHKSALTGLAMNYRLELCFC